MWAKAIWLCCICFYRAGNKKRICIALHKVSEMKGLLKAAEGEGKMKVVVLAGGISTERDVSLSSGSMIYKALKNRGHKAILLDVYLGYEGEWEKVFVQETDWAKEVGRIGETNPDIRSVKALRRDGGKSFFGPHVIEICQQADLVFLALHGENGENGLDDYSVVSASYNIDGECIGTISVLGPTRMDYSKVISSLEYMQKMIEKKAKEEGKDNSAENKKGDSE